MVPIVIYRTWNEAKLLYYSVCKFRRDWNYTYFGGTHWL